MYLAASPASWWVGVLCSLNLSRDVREMGLAFPDLLLLMAIFKENNCLLIRIVFILSGERQTEGKSVKKEPSFYCCRAV